MFSTQTFSPALLLTALLTFLSAANAQYVAITGVFTGINSQTHARPFRRNIMDLTKDVPSWSLFVQALNEIQTTPESSPMSWFGLAGIHGRPYTGWENVGQTPGAPTTGFCTHDSVLFPTWHRPYLALYEQVIATHVQRIVKTYPQSLQPAYQVAADNLRIPYWDWASIPTMPPVTSVSTTQIINSAGAHVTVNNPLYQYKFLNFPLNSQEFPTDSSQGDAYLAAYRQTVRSPDQQGGASDFTHANAVLSNDNLMQRTWYSLVKSTTFDNFATTSSWGPALEGVHGSVHVDVGGNYGHMTVLSYSAFDPIFFLHHANVDRLTAMWQAMYPNSYLTNFVDQYGTYSIVPGSTDTLTTPLEPFTATTSGTFWTSNSARYLSTFGYSYPEITDWNQSPTQLKANVTAIINKMYNPNGAFTKRSRIAGKSTAGILQEWSVEIQVSKADLGGAQYVVRLFIGAVPADPSTWSTSPAQVGSFAVLPPPKSVLAALGSTAPLSFDEVSLVTALKAAGISDDSQVEAFLTTNLSWKVQLVNGTVVDNSALPNLLVTVQDETVDVPPTITEVPVFTNKVVHPSITHGKNGGLQHAHNP